MKSIHKTNRKGKRAVHKRRKHGKWSNTFVQTTTYSTRRQLLLQLESHNRNVVAFFCTPNPERTRHLGPPDLPAFWFLSKVAEVRKLPLQLTPFPESQREAVPGTAASVKVAKDRRPFATKSTLLIRNNPPTQPFYYIRKNGIVKDFILFFFALFGLTHGTKWDILTRPNNGRKENEIL